MFLALISGTTEQFPNHNIIVRPHPSENVHIYATPDTDTKTELQSYIGNIEYLSAKLVANVVDSITASTNKIVRLSSILLVHSLLDDMNGTYQHEFHPF